MNVEGQNFNEVYRGVIEDLIDFGEKASPRGMETREVLGARIALTNPLKNILVSPERKLNYRFSIAEFIWIVLGQNDTSITTWNKNLMPFSDDNERFAGAYGPKFIEQLSYVIALLTKDPDSRQAVINIWRERPGPSKDVPCTLSFQFFIRDHSVHMVTTMRSNDVYLGLPYDLFNFTMIQNLVTNMLEFATGVQYELGTYVHNVGSLHFYMKDYEKLRTIVNECNPKVQNSWLDWNKIESSRFGGYEFAGLRYEFNRMAHEGERLKDHITVELDKRFDQYGGVWGNLLKVLASKWHPELVTVLREPYRSLLS